LASSLDSEIPRLITIEVVHEPSIDPQVGVSVVSAFGSSWMDLVIEFLAEDQLPSESKEAERVRRVAAQFWLSQNQRLYRRSFGGPYLLCLHPSKVNDLWTELHEGVWGNHVKGLWPKIQRDAAEYVKRCEQCQKHALVIHQP